MSLSDTSIRRWPVVDRETWVSDGNGLYLRISPRTQSKTWVFRTKTLGKTSKVTLGTWPTMPLAAARSVAASMHLAPKSTPASVANVVDDFVKANEPYWKEMRSVTVYTDRLKKEFGNRQVGTLTRQELVQSLQAYAAKSPVAANHCRSRWQALLEYCVERGFVTNNVLVGTTNRIAGGPQKSRDRVLSDAEILHIMQGQTVHYKLLRSLLRSGCRVMELLTAQKTQIEYLPDEDIKLHIPQNKSDRPHWVYFDKAALADLNLDAPMLFAPLTYAAMQQHVSRLGLGFTMHDLRRTFATRLSDMGCSPVVVEKLLNHSLAGGVFAIYNRAEYEQERIEWTAKWSQYLDDLLVANPVKPAKPVKEKPAKPAKQPSIPLSMFTRVK